MANSTIRLRKAPATPDSPLLYAARFLALGALAFLQASVAGAQTITTGAAPAMVEIPVDHPAALAVLALALAALASWTLLDRRGANGTPFLWSGILLLAVWGTPALRAQALSQFTDPAGETLPIPILPIEVGGVVQGFERADFENASGADLLILDIEEPGFAECFPLGLTDPLPPLSPIGAGLCEADAILPAGAECSVDVDTICKQLAADLAVIAVAPPDLSFPAGATGDLTVTNDAGSPVAAENVTATIPGGSSISVQSTTCGASLAVGASCTITLTSAVVEGPTTIDVVGANTYAVTADITVVSNTATLGVTPSPLVVTANGPTGSMTVTNTSALVTALNVTSDFTGTALDGAVTETGNTCASVAPGESCSLTFTPGNSVVPEIQFVIAGSNTASVDAAIEIQSGSTLTAVSPGSGPASGGTGVTLTGTGLTGATGLTFDGIAATFVNVVNSTTVTAVTPAHAAGVVDVVIDTPAGGATLPNGYTYASTAVGQPSGGGVIAVLNGGLNNLIAATADNSTGIEWGGSGIVVGVSAQSSTDGAANTAAIVAALGNNGGTPYAVQLCNDFEVDSQGNVPCQAGNACYDDWFLPAGNNSTATGQLNGLFTNRAAIGGFANATYWSSTEFSGNPALSAWGQDFSSGVALTSSKNLNLRVRCVRAFVP